MSLSRAAEQSVHRRLYLLLQRARGVRVGEHMAQLARWDRLDRAAFAELRRRRLAAALAFARDAVPLYATGAWREALHGRGSGDLAAWPVLEREVLQARASELRTAAPAGRVSYRTTSGSTGRPLRIVADSEATAWSRASDFHALGWHGAPLGCRTMIVENAREGRALDWVRNFRRVPARDLSAHGMAAAARGLLDERPVVLTGYTTALLELARQARAMAPARHGPLARVVKLFGEMVYPVQRTELERLTGGRVVESYGCAETGIIAHECPAGALHVLAPHVEVEVLRADGGAAAPGEMGDIVLTGLTNRAMPLVRYRVGDRGRLVANACPCGRPHPVLADVEGRIGDVLLTASSTDMATESAMERV